MRADQLSTDLYPTQLEEKVARIREQFAGFTQLSPEVFTSEPAHYRQRAEFRVWHEGDELFHIMFDAHSKEKYRVDQYLAADERINNAMQVIIDYLRPRPALRKKLFQIDYLSTLKGELLISLIYHRQLDEEWINEAKQLKAYLNQFGDTHLIGRARKQKIVLDQEFVVESLPVAGKHYQFKQIENSFTQPNAGVNSKMIEWALDVTVDNKGDLLELYCGLGNFSLPLAQNFRRVLATEISKPSVAAAQYNIAANNIDNVTILRMSSEEFTAAITGQQTFSRLEGIDLASYQCDTILVDPPRAGLDDATLEMVSGYQNIVYISCNPDTLADNLEVLQHTHEIKRFALFDQFPYTHHVETGVYLVRKA